MNFSDVLFIGVALAMDAFALTIANCASFKNALNGKKGWAMPITFSLFQFAMPVIGYYVGSLFAEYLNEISKFLTAGIFFILSIKIVIDNLKSRTAKCGDKNESCLEDGDDNCARLTLPVLLFQGIATSMDALIIGVTFATELTFSVFGAGAIIGAVTFLIVACALLFGKYLDKIFGNYAQWLGAVILLVLAVKNLVEGFAA